MTIETAAAPASSLASDNPASRKLPEPIEAALEVLIHCSGDALSLDPIDEPSVASALDAVRAAVWPRLLPTELSSDIREVLGLPNFRTGPIAHVYRAAGHSIRPKMEDEQAFVLFRFLHLALQHGPGWFAESCIDLTTARDAAKAKLPQGDAS